MASSHEDIQKHVKTYYIVFGALAVLNVLVFAITENMVSEGHSIGLYIMYRSTVP